MNITITSCEQVVLTGQNQLHCIKQNPTECSVDRLF